MTTEEQRIAAYQAAGEHLAKTQESDDVAVRRNGVAEAIAMKQRAAATRKIDRNGRPIDDLPPTA